MHFINGIAILLCFQLLGSVIVLWLGLKIPGAVLGMFLLFMALLLMRKMPQSLDQTASSLLKHLSLLFIPAGVGVVVHLQRIGSEWFAIVTTLFVSTLVGMAVTAWVMQWTMRLMQRREADK
jgi:holin-like protein